MNKTAKKVFDKKDFAKLALQHVSFVYARIEKDGTGTVRIRSSFQSDPIDINLYTKPEKVPGKETLLDHHYIHFPFERLTTEKERKDVSRVCWKIAERLENYSPLRLRGLTGDLVITPTKGIIDLKKYNELQSENHLNSLKETLENVLIPVKGLSINERKKYACCLFGAEGRALKQKLVNWGWVHDHWENDDKLRSFVEFVHPDLSHSPLRNRLFLKHIEKEGYAGTVTAF